MKGRKEVQKAVKDIGKSGPVRTQVDNYKSALDNIMTKGMPPKEALGMKDESMESMYANAYRLYNAGKYKDAIVLFRMLTYLDSTDGRYGIALAACYHMMKEYDAAIERYMRAAMLSPQDPVPTFHASDCYLEKHDPASAILMLRMSIARCGNNPAYQVLKDRATLTADGLMRDLTSLSETQKTKT